MNGYQLTRQWFDFAYKNPEVRSQHTALYCWCVELNNRLQWKESFGLPTDESCEHTGIGNRKTFYAALEDLKKWGFIDEIQVSKNQSHSRVIALRLCENAQAEIQAEYKQSTSEDTSTASIDKQVNSETSKHTKPIKESKPKGQSKKFVPPTFEEVEAYFIEHGASQELLDRCYFYYKERNWHNKMGKPVLNWKTTVLNNWILKNQNKEQTSYVPPPPPAQPARRSRPLHESYTFTL